MDKSLFGQYSKDNGQTDFGSHLVIFVRFVTYTRLLGEYMAMLPRLPSIGF